MLCGIREVGHNDIESQILDDDSEDGEEEEEQSEEEEENNNGDTKKRGMRTKRGMDRYPVRATTIFAIMINS